MKKIVKLLGINFNDIKIEINKNYAVEGNFVQIRNIDKTQQELKTELLKIPGVKIIEYNTREYPYNEKLAPLIGFVKNGDR